jgi:hypothetical protein
MKPDPTIEKPLGAADWSPRCKNPWETISTQGKEKWIGYEVAEGIE